MSNTTVRFMQGNDALVEGAIVAGARFFAGYPITPASEITEGMSVRLPLVGGVFLQMEDEIASMGAAIGASMAGAKCLTSTAGPGFSLKQEGIGIASMMEIPVVIVDVMRGGPASGMSTLPSQMDVMQARWGCHGDHPIIVLSPATVTECYELAIKAFNLAELVRQPVIILSDAIVGHLRERISYYEKMGTEVRCINSEIPFGIPDTWEWVRLENCCSKEIRRGKSPKYAERSGTLVFAQKCNTKYNGIDVRQALFLDEATLNKYSADEYMQDGDVVVNSTGTGTLGRVGFYRMADNCLGLPIVPDSHVTVVRGFSSIQAFYLYAFMKASQSKLEKKGEGSTNQKELKSLTLKEMLVPVPPRTEQERIAAAITAAFSNISTIEKSLS